MDSLLKKFGYSEDWLEFNILTPEYFQLQVKDQHESGHEGWEHYRYGALVKWLRENDKFTDNQILNIIDIASKEVDQPMANSLIKELASSGKAKQNQVKILNEFLQTTYRGPKSAPQPTAATRDAPFFEARLCWALYLLSSSTNY